MAARSGRQFLERLSAARVHVEVQGETVTGQLNDHPAFRNVIRSYAELYDMQHDPAYRDVLTYPSPATGDPVATSFLVPRTPEDLAKRGQAFKVWAGRSLGMLGRTPDYLNSALMALAAAADWFAQADPQFGDNIRNFYRTVREDDLLCTHTLVPPQANRAVAASQQAGGSLMAHVVREGDDGIVVRGARLLATIGPFADELLVFPSTLLRNTPEDKPPSTSAVVHMTHQVIARTTAKTSYILGLVSLLTEAIGIEQFQHVQADVAEVITTLEMLRAFGRAADADAEPNEFGVLTPAWAPLNAARNLYPRLYQRFPEILRKLGASGLMATPTQADVTGPAAADIETYLQAAALGGAERVKLFRLVWDTCISAFSGRQALYEYYFFGNRFGWPARTSTATTASRTRPPSAPSWIAIRRRR